MSTRKFATIDLGTNTFHLLVVEEGAGGHFQTVFKERQFVHLGEGGVGHLQKQAMQRGWATLSHFQYIMKTMGVQKYRAVGTSALREADNAEEFLQKVRDMGMDVEVIDGIREAELIHSGIQLALGRLMQRILIVDIGGGSVEFILSREQKIEWAKSLPLGVAVLYELSKGVDPITDETLAALRKYIRQELETVREAVANFPPDMLIGASGSFEVLEAFEPEKQDFHLCTYLSQDNFSVLYDEIIQSSLDERLAMPAIPESRAQLIVVAFVLIEEILRLCQFQAWLYSPYAMKEGVLSEMK